MYQIIDRRLGDEPNGEMVSCRAVRAYVRARGAWPSEISAKTTVVPFPFSLLAAPAFPFSLKTHPFSLKTSPSPQSSYPTQLVLFVKI